MNSATHIRIRFPEFFSHYFKMSPTYEIKTLTLEFLLRADGFIIIKLDKLYDDKTSYR